MSEVIAVFDKLSRYRAVPDSAVPDARGRVLAAKQARPLPEATGEFTHTVNSGDRLDQLAFAYYGEPTLYWHICDANPAFLSPLALLGQEPVVTVRFPLTAPAAGPPWAALLKALSGVPGVVDVTCVEEVSLEPQRQTVGGKDITVTVERFARAVRVTFNKSGTGTEALAPVIAATGFTPGPPAEDSRLGQAVVIPPPVSG
jgi:hypothetical protein